MTFPSLKFWGSKLYLGIQTLDFGTRKNTFGAPGVHNLLLMRLNLNKKKYAKIYSIVNYYLLDNIIVIIFISI